MLPFICMPLSLLLLVSALWEICLHPSSLFLVFRYSVQCSWWRPGRSGREFSQFICLSPFFGRPLLSTLWSPRVAQRDFPQFSWSYLSIGPCFVLGKSPCISQGSLSDSWPIISLWNAIPMHLVKACCKEFVGGVRFTLWLRPQEFWSTASPYTQMLTVHWKFSWFLFSVSMVDLCLLTQEEFATFWNLVHLGFFMLSPLWCASKKLWFCSIPGLVLLL